MILMTLTYRWLGGLCLLVTVTCAQAEIYRWVDMDGKVHFSDEKPIEEEVEVVRSEMADPALVPDEGELRRRAYLKSANQLPDTPSSDLQLQTNPNHIDAEQCQRARLEYSILREQVPAYWTPTGELRGHWANDTHRGGRDYISDEERGAEKNAAQERMNLYCINPNDEDALINVWNNYVDFVYCDEYRIKLERAHTRRSRTPRTELARMESVYRSKCD